MELAELQKHWHEFGKIDPLWAILADPSKRGGQWDPAEFFHTGEQDIDALLRRASQLGLPRQRRRALDFGCGVGRLTQALCRHFDEGDGIDIAPSMIELANRHNRHPGRCRYHLNASDDLRRFSDGSFDLVYTTLVLQHMQPRYSRAYVQEFLRVLAPGGLLVFQLPCERVVAPLAAGQSVARRALPRNAFRAGIRVDPPAVRGRPGGESTLRVHVRNLSDLPWPARGADVDRFQVNLGNHWLDPRGKTLLHDDARQPLPRDVQPLEEIEVHFTITNPTKPGAYLLEIDLVQEGVTWFKQRGSQTARVPVEVTSSETPAATAQEPTAFVPRMEMHPVPQAEVTGWVAAAGGRVLHVEQEPMQDFTSCRYWVTR
jgi:SAM-dependent methyltransferase